MKKWTVCLAAVLLCLLPACLSGAEQEEDGLRLWFTAPKGQQKLQVSSALDSCPYEGSESVPGLLSALLAGPDADSELISPIPAGTRVVSWRVEDGVASVELTDAYAGLAGIDLTLADYCVTLTLTQLEGVDGVRITVSGAGQSFQNRRVLRAEDVVLSGEEQQARQGALTLSEENFF